MGSGRAWDFVAISALGLSFCTTGAYFSLMHLHQTYAELSEAVAPGLLLVPIAGLYCAWAVWRSVTRRDLRGGWLAWVACALLFLAAADFSRKLLG